MRINKEQEGDALQTSHIMLVSVKDFDMPFSSIVKLIVKWTFAIIPAVIIIYFIAGVIIGVLKTLIT